MEKNKTLQHSVAVQYYIDHYTPPSPSSILTWKHQSEGNVRCVKWNPHILASVSTLYRSLGTGTDCQTFEINRRQTISNDNAAWLFHFLIPPVPGWDDKDADCPHNILFEGPGAEIELDLDEDTIEYSCDLEVMYVALELCNFLGIQASCRLVDEMYGKPILIDSDKVCIIPPLVSSILMKDIQDICPIELVIHHQLFLRVHYDAGLRACEQIFVLKYSNNRYIANGEYYENDRYLCKIQAYIACAKKMLEITQRDKKFVTERLGWGQTNEFYGVKIHLREPFPYLLAENNGHLGQ